MDGLGGLVDGLVGPMHVFFYFFYFIYRGEHLNRLGNSLIYCDLSTETLQKPPRLMFFARHNYIFFVVVVIPPPNLPPPPSE